MDETAVDQAMAALRAALRNYYARADELLVLVYEGHEHLEIARSELAKTFSVVMDRFDFLSERVDGF